MRFICHWIYRRKACCEGAKQWFKHNIKLTNNPAKIINVSDFWPGAPANPFVSLPNCWDPRSRREGTLCMYPGGPATPVKRTWLGCCCGLEGCGGAKGWRGFEGWCTNGREVTGTIRWGIRSGMWISGMYVLLSGGAASCSCLTGTPGRQRERERELGDMAHSIYIYIFRD